MQDTQKGAEELPQFTAVTTVFSYVLLYIMGHMRDMLRILRTLAFGGKKASSEGYAPLTADWEDFYSRRFYSRIQDCWNRPICSAPGARVDVMERSEIEVALSPNHDEEVAEVSVRVTKRVINEKMELLKKIKFAKELKQIGEQTEEESTAHSKESQEGGRHGHGL